MDTPKEACESYAHAHAISEPLSFRTFRPSLIDLLNATEDVPESKELYAYFQEGVDFDREYSDIELIELRKEKINAIPNLDILWGREPKWFIEPSLEIDALVKIAQKSAALELFDSLRNVILIDYMILDKSVIKGVLETLPGYDFSSSYSRRPYPRAIFRVGKSSGIPASKSRTSTSRAAPPPRPRSCAPTGVAVSEQEILAAVIKAGLGVTVSELEQDPMTEIILTALSGAQTIDDLKKRLLAKLLRDKKLFFKLTSGNSDTDLTDLATKLAQVKLDGTASFADLRKVLPAFGFTAHGLSLSFELLLTLHIPVIVHLRPRGRDHLSVLRGIDRETGLVRLGDPSWGNRKVTAHRFQAIWDGKILVILPQADARNANVKRDFFQAPKPNTLAIQYLMLRSNPLHQH